MQKNCIVKEISLTVKDREIHLDVLPPLDNQLVEDPILLMTFSTDRQTSLKMQPYCLQTEMFLERGHCVLIITKISIMIL